MITSKLTSKAQTTIPQAVRAALGIKPGDEIAYAIADGPVLLTKATKPRPGAPFEDPFVFFGEWDTPEDDEAFGDLKWAPSGIAPSLPEISFASIFPLRIRPRRDGGLRW